MPMRSIITAEYTTDYDHQPADSFQWQRLPPERLPEERPGIAAHRETNPLLVDDSSVCE